MNESKATMSEQEAKTNAKPTKDRMCTITRRRTRQDTANGEAEHGSALRLQDLAEVDTTSFASSSSHISLIDTSVQQQTFGTGAGHASALTDLHDTPTSTSLMMTRSPKLYASAPSTDPVPTTLSTSAVPNANVCSFTFSCVTCSIEIDCWWMMHHVALYNRNGD